jgi:hypothetical protein
LDVAEYKFSKRELALSPCWLGKFLGLSIFQTALGTEHLEIIVFVKPTHLKNNKLINGKMDNRL